MFGARRGWTCALLITGVGCTEAPGPSTLSGDDDVSVTSARAAYVHGMQRRAGADFALSPGSSGRNSAHGFDVYAADAGVTLRSDGWSWTMRTESIGCDRETRVLPPRRPSVVGNRVLYAHQGLDAWFLNGPLGVEHGYTIAAMDCDELLRIVIAHRGLEARRDDRSLVLATDSGLKVLRYGDVYARDAAGEQLRVGIEAAGGEIALLVDVSSAVFPIWVDPLVGTELAKLLALDAELDGHAGSGVAISGDTIAMSAPGADDYQGSVAVFVESAGIFSQQATLTAADAGEIDHFGHAVAIDAGRVFVGAPGDDESRGSVYVLDDPFSGLYFRLTADDGEPGDQLGTSLWLAGNTLVVGAPGDDDDAADSGAVYVFDRQPDDTWEQRAKLKRDVPVATDAFGSAVVVVGNRVAVGVPGDDTLGSGAGAVVMFERVGNNWSSDGEYTAWNGAAGDAFGTAVDMDAAHMIVGAPFADDAAPTSGTAYIFADLNGSWVQDAQLSSPTAGSLDHFGYSVALDQGHAMVGAPYADFSDNGAVSVHDEGDWTFGTPIYGGLVGGHLGLRVALEAAEGAAAGAADDGEIQILPVYLQSGWQFGFAVSEFAHQPGFGLGLASAPGWLSLGIPAVGRCVRYESSAGFLSIWDEADNLDEGLMRAVDVDGDTLIVGAPGKGLYAGAAYVFERSGNSWMQQAKLRPPDTATFSDFGDDVAIDGATVVVGRLGDDSAYVYVRISGVWTLTRKLVGASGFGTAVAIDDATIVVGASSSVGQGRGYVYVESAGTWTEQDQLVASDADGDECLGRAADIDADTIVLGAPCENGGAGAAYVFVRNAGAWSEEAKLVTASGAPGDAFGASVGVDGNTIVVGSRLRAASTGAGYLFTRSAGVWTEVAELVAASAGPGDEVGTSAAIDGDKAILGAPKDDDMGVNAGTAYVFSLGLSNGESCSIDDECSSRHCVDGVCCDEICDGLCRACSASLKGVGNDGACGPIVVATDPEDECAADTPSSCGLTGACDGAGACELYASGLACSAVSCVSGDEQQNANVCDGGGNCVSSGTSLCQGGHACVGGSCSTVCGSDADCQPAFFCQGGSCIADLVLGVTCTLDTQCGSGLCRDGVCCESSCTGACATCSAVPGSCTALAEGDAGSPSCAPFVCSGVSPECPGSCDGDSGCAGGFFCNEGLACEGRHVAGQPCDAATECANALDCQVCVDGATCVEKICCLSVTAGDCRPAGASCATNAECASGFCAGDHCGMPCSSNADCPDQFVCDGVTMECVAESAQCDGDHTITDPDGGEHDCAPYRCDPVTDGCFNACTSSADCVDDTRCSFDGRCVPPASSTAPPQTTGSCATSSRPAHGDPWLLLLGLGLLRWLVPPRRSLMKRAHAPRFICRPRNS